MQMVPMCRELLLVAADQRKARREDHSRDLLSFCRLPAIERGHRLCEHCVHAIPVVLGHLKPAG